LVIVDCNSERDILHAYLYTEVEDGKGEYNVTSLLMKYQRQNNFVLRLAPYFIKTRYFKLVGFIIHVDGHIKKLLTTSSIKLEKVIHEECRQKSKTCIEFDCVVRT